MTEPVQRAYRYRFYPTPEQEEQFSKIFGCCRYVYNHFLNLRSTAWKEEKKAINYCACAAKLTELKQEFPWLFDAPNVTLQWSLRNLDRAFGTFFKKRARYPSFKKRGYSASAGYTKQTFYYRDGEIRLCRQKEPLDIRWSRRFSGDPSSVTILKEASGKYYISVLVKEMVAPLPFKKGKVGLYFGLDDTIKDDKGSVLFDISYQKKHEKKLKRLQKALSRSKKGSKNREKVRKKRAVAFEKVRHQRDDLLHKLSRDVVSNNQVIAIESTSVTKILKRRSKLRAVPDVGWYAFTNLLKYKSAWYGKDILEVDYLYDKKDNNSAKKILKEGLRSLKG